MLIINDLSLRIAGRLLLDHASVTLPTGSKAGLVGRNGTGKTTLFRAISGDLSAETGSIGLPAEVEMCMPGDNVKVTVELMEGMPVAMDEGLRFAIREGGKTVGSGVVTKIIA